MRWVSLRWLLAAGSLGFLFALAGCSGGTSRVSVEPGPGKPSAALVTRARLSPCPATSTGKPVAGGLPDLTLPCLGRGPVVHLAGLRGRPTVVNIWAQWCVPCGREAAVLSTVARQQRSVRFLGVDTEELSSADLNGSLTFDMAAKPPIHYPSVEDETAQLLHHYALGPPVTLLVAPSGRVVHTIAGQLTGIAQLRSAIRRYLEVT